MINLKKIAKKAIVFSSGNILNIAIGIGSFPILSKFYSPAEFGYYSLSIYTVGIIATIATLRLDLALSSTKEENEAIKILTTAAILPIIFGLITSIAIWSISEQNRFITSLLFPFFYIFNYCCLTIFTAWFVRSNRFWLAGNLNLIYASSIILFQVVLANSQEGNGLFLGNIIGGLLTLIICAMNDRRIRPSKILKEFKLAAGIEVIKQNKIFLGGNTLQSLINSSSLAILSHGISIIGGLSAVGSFSTCQKILAIPVRVIGNAMRQSLLQGLADLPNKVGRNIAIKATIALIPVSLLSFLFLTISLPIAVNKLMAPEWRGINEYIAPLSIWLSMTVIYTPAIAWLNVQKITGPHLLYEIINLIVRVTLIPISIVLTLNSANYVWITSTVSCILGIALCTISFFENKPSK